MKKALAILLAVTLALSASVIGISAAETPSFTFSLKIDGASEKTVSPGDIVTVVFSIERTDASLPYTMHAFQNEIRYDSTFFALVEDSFMLKSGVDTNNVSITPYAREQYIHHLSLSGGSSWNAKTIVGTFQLRVIGQNGASVLRNLDCSISRPDGKGSYPISTEDVTVIISDNCTVTFDSCGGSTIPPKTVTRGKTLLRPSSPERDGWIFTGWYTDVDCQTPWYFSDTVEGNLHLYAGWAKNGASPAEKILPFTDVKKADWFHESIDYAYQNGLMNGVSSTAFAPQETTTRAMIVTILWRLEGSPPMSDQTAFLDVPRNQWFSHAIAWASSSGIVNGYSETQFGPNDNITREQLVTILYRYTKQKGKISAETTKASLAHFTDCASVNAYAIDAMQWAYAQGVIQGIDSTTLRPQGEATRAQTATFFMRFVKSILNT